MSCILRISGNSLEINAMVLRYQLIANRIWRKGEPWSLKGSTHTEISNNGYFYNIK